MDPQSQPSGRSKRDSQRCCNLDRVLAVHIRVNDNTLLRVGAVVVHDAVRESGWCAFFAEREVDLGARIGCREGGIAAYDGGGGEHDHADRDDSGELEDVSHVLDGPTVSGWSHICPGSHHPRPMLVNLKEFDIDESKEKSAGSGNDGYAAPDSCGKIASKSVRESDESACIGYQWQDNDSVAIEAVENYGLVPNHWSKLEDHQAGCRENAKQV
jgi:hypothetical protein